MEVRRDYAIAAPRETVWAALHDPEVLVRCIPGCRDLRAGPDGAMIVRVALRIGPVPAILSGIVRLAEVDAPRAYVLLGRGSGGVTGFVRGRAAFTLTARGAATLLSCEARIETGGRIAAFGAGLLRATAGRLADAFFGRLSADLALAATQAPMAIGRSARPQAAAGGRRP